jgi:hypothetical protein
MDPSRLRPEPESHPGSRLQARRRCPRCPKSVLADLGEDPPTDLAETRAMIERAKGVLTAMHGAAPTPIRCVVRPEMPAVMRVAEMC